MKGIRYAGLLTAAVSALVMATGASAAFGSEFKTKEEFPVGFTGSGGAGALTTAGHKIECKTSKSKGEAVKASEATKITVEYTECVEPEAPVEAATCGPEGVIKTEELKAEPVDLGGAATAPVGLLLTPVNANDVFAKFECVGFLGASEAVEVKGSLLCESKGASVGKEAREGELVCEPEAGSRSKQKYEKANGGSTVHKLTAIVGGKEEAAAIDTTEVLKFNKLIEQTTP